jgi:diaminopimelate epimerase
VEQCGNGPAASSKFVRDRGLTDKSAIRVQTRSGIIEPRLLDDGRIEVRHGRPVSTSGGVPFSAGGLVSRREAAAALWPLPVAAPGQADTIRWIEALSMEIRTRSRWSIR